MPDTYDHITLMCRLKAAQRRNKELESGERYIQLEELHQKEYNVYEHKIEKLKKELADAHKETIRVRNYWFQVLEDMLREFEKAQKRSAQELRKMEIRALNAEKQREDALDKAAVFRHQFYEAASRLEEEQGKNLKLRAQINRDYENSSIPSSKAVRRKKITNNREKTGRKPGGQPGHKGHCRKRQEPTQPVILLPPPEEVLEDCAFKKTARKEAADKQVLSFINDFREDDKSIRQKFCAGYCYYFAVMLKDAFHRGEICWCAPLGHICWVDDNGVPYDIDGVCDSDCNFFIPIRYIREGIEDFRHVPGREFNASREYIQNAIQTFCILPAVR